MIGLITVFSSLVAFVMFWSAIFSHVTGMYWRGRKADNAFQKCVFISNGSYHREKCRKRWKIWFWATLLAMAGVIAQVM